MQIFVKTLTGKTIVVHVDASDTVDILFTQIQVKVAVLVLQTRLIAAGKKLEVGKTLFDHNIQKHTPHFMVGRPWRHQKEEMSFRLGSLRGTLTRW